jgi:hypothetical protein
MRVIKWLSLDVRVTLVYFDTYIGAWVCVWVWVHARVHVLVACICAVWECKSIRALSSHRRRNGNWYYMHRKISHPMPSLLLALIMSAWVSECVLFAKCDTLWLHTALYRVRAMRGVWEIYTRIN